MKDKEGRVLSSEKEKVEGLVRDLFGWREGMTDLEETEAAKREWGVEEVEKMKTLVERALMGTKNASALGPDGVSYRLIKAVRDMPLGQGLMKEVAESLLEGKTPPEWREMRVVFRPKPGRDLSRTKSWRPINLINCIRKLGEKVVADVLQDAGLLHRKQFGGVKSRSAVEAVFRVVVKARRCMAKGGEVGWGFWDVKGGFRDVVRSEVLSRMRESEEGVRWTRWVHEFM